MTLESFYATLAEHLDDVATDTFFRTYSAGGDADKAAHPIWDKCDLVWDKAMRAARFSA